MSELKEKAQALLAEKPELAQYRDKIIVIKYGGNAMVNEELKAAVLQDVVMLKELGMKPVLAHGGGPGINRLLKQLDIPVRFINGLRYTSEEIMRAVSMVLIGEVGSELVSLLQKYGGSAVGLSGLSGGMFRCVKRQAEEDLGLVGEIVEADPKVVQTMLDAGYIPVVAPIGTDCSGTIFNINGDTAAGKLAGALGAEKLLLLTDIEGLCNSIELHDVISYLNVADAGMLKEKGVISGGMIPKVDCCLEAIEAGTASVQIIDGRQPHIIFDAMTKENIGTTIGTEKPSVG
ncbi:MAG: acetylglutamate kinase, partial [Erysipelotrichaceae bacterium]|nr:acetylglutamate kinase [Erysipelotrichaceae bacterium]